MWVDKKAPVSAIDAADAIDVKHQKKKEAVVEPSGRVLLGTEDTDVVDVTNSRLTFVSGADLALTSGQVRWFRSAHLWRGFF